MSQLEIVKQESKSLVLQDGPMPHEEMKIGKCPFIITQGVREGKPCEEKTFDGEQLCSAHQLLAIRKKAKEVEVKVNASQPQVPHINIVPVPQALPVLPPAMPPPNAPIDEILVIMRNFSIAMVNLTELLKRH